MDDEKISPWDALKRSNELMSLEMIGNYLKLFVSYWREWVPCVICTIIATYIAPMTALFLLFGGFDRTAILTGLGFTGLIVVFILLIVEAYFVITKFLPMLYYLDLFFYKEIVLKEKTPEETVEEGVT